MRQVMQAFNRALASQFSSNMLLLSIVPCVLSLVLCGMLLWLGLTPLVDWLQNMLEGHGGYVVSGGLLNSFGLDQLKTLVVLLLAMILLLPLMILTSLILMELFAVPAIARHVGKRHFASLEKHGNGNVLGNMLASVGTFALFLVVWVALLPLYLVPPVAFLAQIFVWGRLTSRVMASDALEDYASTEERKTVLRLHRKQLMVIGMVCGAGAVIPSLVWVSALATVLLFPVLAPLSVWLSCMVFMFTALWYQHFCMQALTDLRAATPKDVVVSAA